MPVSWQSSYLVRAPIERVFAYLADPRNAVSRRASVKIEPVSDVEHRYRVSGLPSGAFIVELNVIEPPHRLVGRTWKDDATRSVDGSVTYQLHTVPGGTQVSAETRLLHVKGLGAFAWQVARAMGLLALMNRRMIAKRTSAIEAWAAQPDGLT